MLLVFILNVMQNCQSIISCFQQDGATSNNVSMSMDAFKKPISWFRDVE